MSHIDTLRLVLTPISVTFAGVEYSTTVPVAAKWKGQIEIKKRTRATVILTGGAESARGLYARMVRKSAATIPENSVENIESFQSQDSWFLHDESCFSIVRSKKDPEKTYLYGFFNSANRPKTIYYINGIPVHKGEIREYLTASKAKEIFESTGVTHNKTYDVTHKIVPRTIGFDNIETLRVRKTVFLK